MRATHRDAVFGVVGLGDIGGAMARSMVQAGLKVVVHDTRQEAVDGLVAAGAVAARSLADLAARAKVISIVVVDDDQVRAVVDGILAAAPSGTTVLIHSTVLPSTVVALAEEASHKGISVVDAAVSGGSEKAVRGTLTVMVGGDEATTRACRPVFDAVGDRVFYVGPVGSGSAAKLVNNMLTLGSYALQLEAMQLGAAYGIDEDTLTAIVTASQGDSRGMRTWGRMDRIREDRTSKAGSDAYARLVKDLREAAIAGGLRSLIMPVTAVAAELLPAKLMDRDHQLAGRPARPAIPRCARCDQELAAPFRDEGTHPECRDQAVKSGLESQHGRP